jgi:hypothetical protein
MKWDEGGESGEVAPKTSEGVTIHVDRRLQDALMDADQEREKELKELK